MVCFGAFAQFIFGVIQKTRQWGSDVIRNQEEDAGAELVLPDIYLVSVSSDFSFLLLYNSNAMCLTDSRH